MLLCCVCIRMCVCHEMKAIQWQTNNFLVTHTISSFFAFTLYLPLSLFLALTFLFLFINLLFIQPLSFSQLHFFFKKTLSNSKLIHNFFNLLRFCCCSPFHNTQNMSLVCLHLTPFHQKTNWIDLHNSRALLPFSIWLIISHDARWSNVNLILYDFWLNTRKRKLFRWISFDLWQGHKLLTHTNLQSHIHKTHT